MKTKITFCCLKFALLIAACSRPAGMAGSSALKPIEQAALQIMVDAAAKELLVPGAVVLLRTPQGDFIAASDTRSVYWESG